MSNDNTRDAAEPSLASAGSQLREQIAALVHDAMRFDREAKTPKWQGGNSYAEGRARRAANDIAAVMRLALTDEERCVIWTVAEAYAENDGDPECERIARIMQGLWQRTK
jgi:hypothetical protein